MKRSVKLVVNGEEYAIPESANLLEALLSLGFDVSHACGGMGSCGTCRVRITGGLPLPERNELEAERAQELGFADSVRLSCQLPCVEGLSVEISC